MPSKKQTKSFTLIDTFAPGYKDKRDVTKEKPGTAIIGSQNVITVDGEKIGIRPGYSILGASNSSATGIKGGGNWRTHDGTEIPWRSYDDELEIYQSVESTAAWSRLANGLTVGTAVRGATIWDTTEVQDLMIFVYGDADLNMWSGGMALLSSATSNTITKTGTTTWAEERFLTAGTTQVEINGTTYTYTGGTGTTTLTGVTPDPSSEAANSLILQTIRTSSNTPAAAFDNDFVAVLNNQLYVFDKERRDVYISANNSYTNFTFSSPRTPGEGALITLDEPPTAAYPLDDQMAISTRNYWYLVSFKISDDNTAEYIQVKRLKSSPLSGAGFDLAAAPMKNLVIYASTEPTIDQLGNIENINTPQAGNLSDSIKNTMNSLSFTSSTIQYHKNNLYIGCNNNANQNNRVLVYNLANSIWETPWLLPAGILFEYNGDLYIHSSNVPETYKLLDGYTDNNTPIAAKWFSAHEDYGKPFNQKMFTEMWIEGYIRPGTTLDIFLTYDFGEEVKQYKLKGTNTDVTVVPTGGGLGTYSLGTRSLGGRGETLSASGMRRFRGKIAVPQRPFYELQTSFQSTGQDYRWEIVSFGYNLRTLISEDNTRLIN